MSWLRSLAICENERGSALEALGRHAEATESFRKAVAHSRQLLEADPLDAIHQLDQATMLRRLACNLITMEDYEAAQAALEGSLSILRGEPASEHPRTNWLRALTRCRVDKAELLLARDRVKEAEAELAMVRELLATTAFTGATDLVATDIRAFAHWAQSLLFERQDNSEATRTEASAAVELLRPVVDDSFTWRRARTYLAAVGVAQGDAERAVVFDRFLSKGYVPPASRSTARGN
jgi:tetratricopeptide (TPR) repeat protein